MGEKGEKGKERHSTSSPSRRRKSSKDELKDVQFDTVQPRSGTYDDPLLSARSACSTSCTNLHVSCSIIRLTPPRKCWLHFS